MTETQMAQAQVLLQVERYQDAERWLREALASDPNHARAHALLAYALYFQDRDTEALQEAETAIGLEPDNPSYHHARALALLALRRTDQAMKAIGEALRLDPENAAHHAVVSRIYVGRKEWRRALQAAEAGLRADPEDVQCANLRSLALANLGHKKEAGQAIEAALARDPESALIHTTQGWVLLHCNDPQKALTHFGEALRLNPMLDWARQGIVEALKARNPVYRLMLRYFLWMSRLTSEEQWGFTAATVGVRRALYVIARQVPILYVVVLPFSLLYFLFAFLTWTARPLFALFLRFDRLGRLSLPREEIVASNWVAACLLAALAGLILGLALGNAAFTVMAAVALAMILPIAGVFRCDPGTSRAILIAYTALLALVGLAASGLALVGSWALAPAGILGVAFAVGWVLYSWIAKLIITLARK